MSDGWSHISSASSARKRIDKHCNGGSCNGKKIAGKQWGPHKKTHIEENDVKFEVCDGADCKQCQLNFGKLAGSYAL
jgi:hypothetical protein